MKKMMVKIAVVWAVASMVHAGVVINVNEVYNEGTSQTDIVWDWSGSLNLTGATQVDLFGGFGTFVKVDYAQLWFYSSGNTLAYSISGPSYYALGDGSAYNSFSSISANTPFAINNGTQVWVGQSYVSGGAITGTNVMANKTISGIGLDAGTYVWTMAGSGDTVTMNVIPEPATAMILGLGGALIALYRRFFGRI